jgi:hypothetical protein
VGQGHHPSLQHGHVILAASVIIWFWGPIQNPDLAIFEQKAPRSRPAFDAKAEALKDKPNFAVLKQNLEQEKPLPSWNWAGGRNRRDVPDLIGRLGVQSSHHAPLGLCVSVS